MTQPTDRRAHAERVIQGLKRAYPDAHCELNFTSPFELLVATILSAQCTDERVNQVTADLFRRYRSPADYARAPQEVLEQEIHSTGFFRQKARSIRGMADALHNRFADTVPRSIDEMVQLPGVARKTANVVLGSAYGIPSGIVVDTHVLRVSYRLALTDQKQPEKVEQDLMDVVPKDEWIWFSHAMIWHGRRVCFARAPNCGGCVLNDICPKRGVGVGLQSGGRSRSRRGG
ncbi:MAG TPA: endonuclease III [Chloroflexota bacterium]|nr:endonuclease III [Chloroflexota bacterium]